MITVLTITLMITLMVSCVDTDIAWMSREQKAIFTYFHNLPNGHSTSNPCRFHVDITSIRWRPNFGEFRRHFHVLFRWNFANWKIQVVSMYFFWRNFDGRKIHVVSTYFFQCNFDSRKIHVVSTYFYRCNFAGQKCTLFPRNFFDAISMAEKFMLFPRTFFEVFLMVEKSTLFACAFFNVISMDKNLTSLLVSCMLMKTFEEVFLG